MAATIPPGMESPTRVSVLIDSASLLTTATIAWAAPTETGGTPITGFRI